MIELALRDIFDLQQGFAFKSKDFKSDGVPILKIKNVKSSGLSLHQLDYVEGNFIETHSKYIPTQGDALISMSGNRLNGSKETWVGKVCLFNEKQIFLVNQRVGILKNKNEKVANTAFLVYALSTEYWQLRFAQTATSSGGQANLSTAQILEQSVFLPSLSEQKAIAHILGTLDDKIELNQKMNQTLEDIAKAIFKSWFVDFDPVRAKAEGRSTGLPADISDLFPDAFEDSEIGEIPVGWEIRLGSDIYSHQKGLSYKGEFLSDSPVDIPMLNLGSFAGNGGYREEKIKFYRGDFKDRHCINETDLLVANTDLTQDRLIIGSPILVPNVPSGHRFYLHTHHTTKITPRDESGVSNIFLYFTFLQSSFRERVSGFAAGTTVLALPKDTFDALQLIIPSPSARIKFDAIVTPILARRNLIATENRVLRELRDTLLPKLISGELRVPNAEKFLAEAGI